MSSLKLFSPRTLSLFRPSVADWRPEVDDDPDGPVILRYPGADVSHSGRIAGRIGPEVEADEIEPLERARILHLNRTCPACGRAAVVPIDATSETNSSSWRTIPGAEKLLGFGCDCCGHTWNS